MPLRLWKQIGQMCSIAIVKVGARGITYSKGQDDIMVSAVPCKSNWLTQPAREIILRAGFLYGLTCGYSLEKCGKIGSLLSANVIQVVGTTLPQHKWNEIKVKYQHIVISALFYFVILRRYYQSLLYIDYEKVLQ